MKVFREAACFVCISRPFNSLAPLYEKAFWPLIVFRRGILRSVLDERKTRSLASEHFKNSFKSGTAINGGGGIKQMDISMNSFHT